VSFPPPGFEYAKAPWNVTLSGMVGWVVVFLFFPKWAVVSPFEQAFVMIMTREDMSPYWLRMRGPVIAFVPFSRTFSIAWSEWNKETPIMETT